MNKSNTSKLKTLRKSYHLKLKDVSFILNIDPSNLSRFEAGHQHSKALIGYHILFNLALESSMGQLFQENYDVLIHRCFQLLELIDASAQTGKNQLRKKSINIILENLTSLEEQYEN